MLNAFLDLILGILLVLFSAFGFVNAVEYAGYKLKLGSSFVGAIISPLFTSLPELTVFLVALFSGVRSGEEIGIGTIFGQPFMASSLSYGLVGITALIGYTKGRRSSPNLKVEKSLYLPYAFVTILFPLTIIPGFERGLKTLFSLVFFSGFIAYACIMYRKKELGIIEEAEELYMGKIFQENVYTALLQLILSTLILYYGSERLVYSVSKISLLTGISPLGISLILIPAATAIPETASAMIWGFRGKDTLSMGSLVGEKILYSTFYPGLALFLTDWKIDDHAIFSVITTTIVSLIILKYILKGEIPWKILILGSLFFFMYSFIIFFLHA